jgi:hypothetical protein
MQVASLLLQQAVRLLAPSATRRRSGPWAPVSPRCTVVRVVPGKKNFFWSSAGCGYESRECARPKRPADPGVGAGLLMPQGGPEAPQGPRGPRCSRLHPSRHGQFHRDPLVANPKTIAAPEAFWAFDCDGFIAKTKPWPAPHPPGPRAPPLAPTPTWTLASPAPAARPIRRFPN